MAGHIALERTAALPQAVPASAFAEAMSTLAGGVALVTSRVEGRPWGMTVTSLTSVSADPPTILVSLGSSTASARSIRASGRFGVSVLGERHAALARLASRPGAPKHIERFCDPAGRRDASPAITGALAHLDCALDSFVVVADHVVLFGRVEAVRQGDGGEPLVYFRRAYRTLG